MTQAERCLILYNELLEKSEIDVSNAKALISESGQNEVSLRSIQRDLKTIYITIAKVHIDSQNGKPSRYYIPKIDEISKINQEGDLNTSNPLPELELKEKTSNKSASKANSKAKPAKEKSDKSAKKTRKSLPKGFDKIDKHEVKAQRLAKIYRKMKFPKKLAEEVGNLAERNSISPESVKFTRKGKLVIYLKKVDPHKIAPFIKHFGDKIELE